MPNLQDFEVSLLLAIIFNAHSPYFVDKLLFTALDRLGPSTAAFAIGVLLGLIIIVDGWFAFMPLLFLH